MAQTAIQDDVKIYDEYGQPSSPRTAKLKETTWFKHTRAGEFAEEGIKVCMDRARIATRVHKETEGEPEVIRHGKATNRILSEATVVIRENEMIAGYNASAPNKIPWTPEASTFAVFELQDTPYVESQDQQEVEDIIDYWTDHSIQARFEKSFPLSEEATKMFRSGAFGEPGS
ncbi:MAG: pyruvate formate lyase family protein, partial [Syntrophales bacterium]|nr:pyruvate formate lyase family protein [Syntrophales bacterium]